MFEPIWKRSIADRDYHRLEVEGSPVFNIAIADIPASGSMFYGTEHRAGIMDYLPMNMIRIVNKGGTNLAIYLNDSASYEVILADTIYTHRGNVYTFTLENLSAVAAATGASIFTTMQHEPLEG
jgi:hypothetical protein